MVVQEIFGLHRRLFFGRRPVLALAVLLTRPVKTVDALTVSFDVDDRRRVCPD